ncbi:MAG TPA: hypothetical protein VG388_10375, partial [Solirubrobacteraceae bacterium]|nr:hypothetical protein [Solirubrobacteraceae bacterium]
MRVVVRGLALAARRSRACRLVLACASAFALLAVPAAAAGASTISGRAFDDPSRTGVYQPGD